MSDQLKLMLNRYIPVRQKSNKLGLPLDRKIGELDRLTYVLAGSLPLRMERKQADQLTSNELPLSLGVPLRTIKPPFYFISKALPLPLSIYISEQPEPSKLPLSMSRSLNTAFTEVVVQPPVIKENVLITANAIAEISPIAQTYITTDTIEVGAIVTARCELNPTASATAIYDSNVFRGMIADVSGDMQQSKIQNISKLSELKSSDQLNTHKVSSWQQSELISTDRQLVFESNKGLQANSKLLFEQSKLISDSNTQQYESQKFIGHKSQLRYEQARLAGRSQYYSFEAMAKRQIENAIHGENSKLVSDVLSTFNEYSYLIGQQKELRKEFARLPYTKLRYVPPPLSQTVILKEQIIEDWECGSGALHYYVYNDEIALPIHRRVDSSVLSNSLAFPLSMPAGVLELSEADANAMETRPCKRKTLAVNPFLDVVMCQPKVFGKASGIKFAGIETLTAIALLDLLIEEKYNAYNKGVIFVTNSVSLTRSDDGREIKLLGFTVNIDKNSYLWSFSATVPSYELSKVNIAYEQQIEVEFVCNGKLWRFIIDSCDDSAVFGESSLSIKGKSRSLLLANPYAAQRGFKYTSNMSARQIAEDELNRFGIASGFTLDWQLAGVNGWNVPANTYSYSNKTPINSLQWIAEAAGGFVNTHMSEDIIQIMPSYPVPSWEWKDQAPSISIPISMITSRSRGRINKPAYNGVTIYGDNDNGIGALIKRRGTAGGYQPSMITSDLMTDQDAAISRGKAILSDTGDIGNIGITIPLHDDIGVLLPSVLLGVDDGEQWIGMVNGTSISGRLSNNRTLQIDQDIDIERHFDKESI